ncbi:MAG: hypothetical protein ACM34E_14090, partial [Acidobacteriota bacterium]
MRFLKWLAALLVLTASLAKGQKSPESDVLIITNVEVVDTRQGLTSPNLTVVIKQGRVDSIAKH